MSGAYDVQMMPLNRFIFQVDGPKSLQIIEKAFKADFHDLRFARNKTIDVDGDEVFVHRLGMSGALAYEIQGDESIADKVFNLVVEAGEEFGMKTLGIRQYMCGGVHTPGGYPNHLVHCAAPGYFAPESAGGMGLAPAGSAKATLTTTTSTSTTSSGTTSWTGTTTFRARPLFRSVLPSHIARP